MAQDSTISKQFHQLLMRARLAGIDVKNWEDAAHRYSTACGCGLGAAFGVGSLGLLIILIFQQRIQSPLWLAVAIVAAFAMVGVGKAVGIGLARVKLRLLDHEIRRALGSRSIPTTLHSAEGQT
jgi:hypothetical protein